jgi:hypothetical protein
MPADSGIPDLEKPKALRCLDLFEGHCVVAGSVRQGMALQVAVEGKDHGTGDRKSAHEPGGSSL